MLNREFGETLQGMVILAIIVATTVFGSLGLLVYQALKAIGLL